MRQKIVRSLAYLQKCRRTVQCPFAMADMMLRLTANQELTDESADADRTSVGLDRNPETNSFCSSGCLCNNSSMAARCCSEGSKLSATASASPGRGHRGNAEPGAEGRAGLETTLLSEVVPLSMVLELISSAWAGCSTTATGWLAGEAAADAGLTSMTAVSTAAVSAHIFSCTGAAGTLSSGRVFYGLQLLCCPDWLGKPAAGLLGQSPLGED